MILGKQSIAGFALALFVASTLPAQAGAGILKGKKKKDDDLSTSRKPTASQNELINKAILREKVVIKTIKERAPLVETYIQNMKPDPLLGQVPESDQHFLSRVDFKSVINDDTYAVNKDTSTGTGGSKLGFFKHSASYIGSLGGSLHLTFHEAGFVQMLLMDSNNFDRQHYNFGYVRNDFLGNTPTAVYVEESDPKSVSRTLKFKAINHIWGYLLKVPPPEAADASLDVVGATDVSNEAQDVSPLGAQRAWVQQAEDNIVERLFQAGLLDAPSEFDKTLEALANNILAYNNITL